MAVKWKWNNNTGGGNVPANLEQRIQAVETKASTNETNITNLNNSAVKTTGNQSIAGVKTFTGTGEIIKINPGSDTSSYLSGYKSGNQRVWYFGKSSSTDNHLRIGADRGNIKLEPNGNGVVDLSNKKISSLADPSANQDGANKQYVDNRIKTRTLTQTINTNSSFTVAPTQGYQLINVMIGRKRTSDNYFFFTYHETLNFQFYVNSSNNFIIWNQGNVGGFNNEYKIIITEMKV